MIVSVSERTDIPAYFSEWFFNRLKSQFVYTRNPFNPKQVTKVNLDKDSVDGFVFWTKNPAPFMKYLDQLKEYTYYFNFTLTPYDKDIEPNLPNKETRINTFQALAHKIGKKRVIWRYDPILINDTYTLEYHKKAFERLCKRLHTATSTVIISFIDDYKNTRRHNKALNLTPITEKMMKEIGKSFSIIAKRYNLELKTCAETIDLSMYDITHARCIDHVLFSRLTNKPFIYEKNTKNREMCLCTKSIDIGVYNTCLHHCKYCYANYNEPQVNSNYTKHNVNSPFLIGELSAGDTIKEPEKQLTIFNLS